MTQAIFAIFVCLGALAILLWMVRQGRRVSLGLSVAYMVSLLINHIPGAYAYVTSKGSYGTIELVYGISLTALGAACFVVGVLLARFSTPLNPARLEAVAAAASVERGRVSEQEYWLFCLIGGWFLVYAFSTLVHIASLSALVQQGGGIWMLGVMLGLADAYKRKSFSKALLWASALAIYPSLMLILGGFLSYGSAAVIIVFSVLAVVVRRYWMTIVGLALVSIAGITVFVNYFAIRNQLRDEVWSGGAMQARLDVLADAAKNFELFTPKNPAHLQALDLRLNQNYFIGVAAERLDTGFVSFLKGQSIVDGIIALVPRVIWRDKPVVGGSGNLVRDMTGLDLDQNTSWGVGNVMEFYINFGVVGVIVGFLILGFAIGWLDRKAALSLRYDERGKVFLYFLPAVAMIQPIGSLVEITSGSAAAFLAAFGWRYAWQYWERRHKKLAKTSQRLLTPRRAS